MNHHKHRVGFTLIELMVVITLMTIAVSAVVLKLDGLSARTRLASAGRRMMSAVDLARTESRTTGRPQLIEYPADGAAEVMVSRPVRSGGSWSWGAATSVPLDRAVWIDRVLVEGADRGESDSDVIAVGVRPGGRHRAHAVVLRSGERFAAVFFESSILDRFVMFDRPPQAVSFELLVMEARRDPEDD